MPAATAATSLRTPVLVSACTRAITSGCRMGASRAPGSSGRPHGASTRTTSAPQRPATSHIRSPNRPLTPITTTSPGSDRVDEGRLHARRPGARDGQGERVRRYSIPCAVGRTSRRADAMNSGSRWPSMGRASPAVASGYGLHGPGPIRTRSVTTMSGDRRRAPLSSRYEERADQAVEDVGFGRQARVEAEVAHQLGQHDGPARRSRRPGRARLPGAAGGRRRARRRGSSSSRSTVVRVSAVVVDPVAVVGAKALVDGGQGGDRPGQADQAGRGPEGRLTGADVGQQLGDEPAGRAQLLAGRRVGGQEPLGDANTADVEATRRRRGAPSGVRARRPAPSTRLRCRRPARGRRQAPARQWHPETTGGPPRRHPATRAGRPRPAAAAAKKSSRLAASRAAEVAVIRTRCTP